MVRVVRVEPVDDGNTKLLSFYSEDYFKHKIVWDTDFYAGDKLLFSFRKGVLDNKEWLPVAVEHLGKPVLTSDRRMIAGAAKTRLLVKSGIIGYYDRLTPQMKAVLGVHKAGRKTAFTANHPEDWRAVVPMFQLLNDWYKEVSPRYYAIQKKEAARVRKDLLIPRTVFSTVTVNRDWRTATHTDRGNFDKALSCMAVLGKGFRGGMLGFPRHRVAIRMDPGDAVLMDGHEPHCNTPLTIKKGGTRFSMVCYLRQDMSAFHKPVRVGKNFYYV